MLCLLQALLLLNQLTRGNANIQKIVAFENAFERLLDIIHEEGESDGGKLLMYSKTCVKWPLKNRQNKDLNDKG